MGAVVLQFHDFDMMSLRCYYVVMSAISWDFDIAMIVGVFMIGF
jgi:hypothetical protein